MPLENQQDMLVVEQIIVILNCHNITIAERGKNLPYQSESSLVAALIFNCSISANCNRAKRAIASLPLTGEPL